MVLILLLAVLFVYHRHGTKRTVLCASCTTLSKIEITRSISSPVFSNPSDSRIEQWASSSDRPIASKACDGFGEPERQAEPDDSETPF
jgi:hypothetical protein